jgi:UDP-N-acetylmuramate--alanine ligase
MHSFSGTRRRFEFKGEARGIRVIDDYGHHPTEIAVTLATARRYAGTGRLLVIFQPHRYSRTKAFAVEFASALSVADFLFLLEVYPASEAPILGVTSALIAKSLEPSKVLIEPSMISMVAKVVLEAKSGDVILTLGAGDVSSLAPVIVNALSE